MLFWRHASRSLWLHRLLVLAVVASVWLGLVHRALHGAPSMARVVTAAGSGEASVRALDGLPTPQLAQAPAQPGHTHGGLLSALFGSHEGGTVECRLYDLLGQSDLATAPVLALPPLPPLSRTVHRLRGESLARWAALFDARGPPAVH